MQQSFGFKHDNTTDWLSSTCILPSTSIHEFYKNLTKFRFTIASLVSFNIHLQAD